MRWFEDVDCEAEFAGCLGSELLCAIPAVVYESSDDLEPAIPEHAGAICLLEALRDRRRGLLELRWGIPFGVPYLNARIFSRGDGTALLYVYQTLWDVGWTSRFAVSKVMELQPPGFFQTCLDDPQDATLAACLVGALDVQVEALPWLTGACSPFEGC